MILCLACAKAQSEPETGWIHAGGIGCEVRSVSQAPHASRVAFYEQIADTTERETFAAAVVLEFKRRQAWKLSQPAANDEAGPEAA